jgi:hypothetical protein
MLGYWVQLTELSSVLDSDLSEVSESELSVSDGSLSSKHLQLERQL